MAGQASVFCWKDELLLAWTLCLVTPQIVYMHKRLY